MFLEDFSAQTKSLDKKRKAKDLLAFVADMNGRELFSGDFNAELRKEDNNIRSGFDDKRFMYDMLTQNKYGKYSQPSEHCHILSSHVYSYGQAHVNEEAISKYKDTVLRVGFTGKEDTASAQRMSSDKDGERFKLADPNHLGYRELDISGADWWDNCDEENNAHEQVINPTTAKKKYHFDVKQKHSYFTGRRREHITEQALEAEKARLGRDLTQEEIHTIENIPSLNAVDSFYLETPDIKKNLSEYSRGIKFLALDVTVKKIKQLKSLVRAFNRFELPVSYICWNKDMKHFTLVWAFKDSFVKKSQLVNTIHKMFRYLALYIKDKAYADDCFIDVVKKYDFVSFDNVITFNRHINWKNIVSSYNAYTHNCNPYLYTSASNGDVEVVRGLPMLSANTELRKENQEILRIIDNNELLYDKWSSGSKGGDMTYNMNTIAKHYTGSYLAGARFNDAEQLAMIMEDIYPYLMRHYNYFSFGQIRETLERMRSEAVKLILFDTNKKTLLVQYRVPSVSVLQDKFAQNEANFYFTNNLNKVVRLYKNYFLNWQECKRKTNLSTSERATIINQQRVDKKILVSTKLAQILLDENTLSPVEIKNLLRDNETYTLPAEKAEYFLTLTADEREYFSNVVEFNENNSVELTLCGKNNAYTIINHLTGKHTSDIITRAINMLASKDFHYTFDKDEYQVEADTVYYPLCTAVGQGQTLEQKIFTITRPDLQAYNLDDITHKSLDLYKEVNHHLNILKRLKGFVLQTGSIFMLPNERTGREPLSDYHLGILRGEVDNALEIFARKVLCYQKSLYSVINGTRQVPPAIVSKVEAILKEKTRNIDFNTAYKCVLFTLNNSRLEKSVRLKALLESLSCTKYDKFDTFINDKDSVAGFKKMLKWVRSYTKTKEASDILDFYSGNEILNENTYQLDKAIIASNRDGYKLNDSLARIITKNLNYVLYPAINRLTKHFHLAPYHVNKYALLKKIREEHITDANSRCLKNLGYADVMLLLSNDYSTITYIPFIGYAGYQYPNFVNNLDGLDGLPNIRITNRGIYAIRITETIHNLFQHFNRYKKYRNLSYDTIFKNVLEFLQFYPQFNNKEMDIQSLLDSIYPMYNPTDLKLMLDDFRVMQCGFAPMYNKPSLRKKVEPVLDREEEEQWASWQQEINEIQNSSKQGDTLIRKTLI